MPCTKRAAAHKTQLCKMLPVSHMSSAWAGHKWCPLHESVEQARNSLIEQHTFGLVLNLHTYRMWSVPDLTWHARTVPQLVLERSWPVPHKSRSESAARDTPLGLGYLWSLQPES